MAISADSPVRVIRLPRTWTPAVKARSMNRRCSSPGPRTVTMSMLLGTTTVWVGVGVSVMDARGGRPSGSAAERLHATERGRGSPHRFACGRLPVRGG